MLLLILERKTMMFGVLKFDTDDSELVSVIANESVKCYQRNSCDLCRASKVSHLFPAFTKAECLYSPAPMSRR